MKGTQEWQGPALRPGCSQAEVMEEVSELSLLFYQYEHKGSMSAGAPLRGMSSPVWHCKGGFSEVFLLQNTVNKGGKRCLEGMDM